MSKSKRKARSNQASAESKEAGGSKPRMWLALAAVVLVLAGLATVVFNGGGPDLDAQNPSNEPKHAEGPAVEGDEPLPVISTTQSNLQREADQRDLDPREDGWDSEFVAELAKKYLSKLLDLAAKYETIDTVALPDLAADFRCNTLRPADLVEAFADPSARVMMQGEQGGGNAQAVYEGASGLARALAEFGQPLRGGDRLHTHAKIIRVKSEADTVTTTAIIETGGARLSRSSYWVGSACGIISFPDSMQRADSPIGWAENAFIR